jgi:quinol monooxygenase YgiN
MSSYVVIVHLNSKPGMADRMVKILQTNMEATHKEPGVIRFTLNRDLDDPNHFVVVEVYKAKSDYDAHHATAHYAACMAALPETLQVTHKSRYFETLPIGDSVKGTLDR